MAPDPYYHLRVITCPFCSTSVVRRRDPAVAGWRRARRVARAILVIIIQAGVFGGGTTAAVALVNKTAYVAFYDHRANPLAVLIQRSYELRPDEVGPALGTLVGSMLLLGLLGGVWIRSALAHLGPVRTWLAWAGIVVLIAASSALAYRFGQVIDPGSRFWGDAASSLRLTHTLTAGAMFAAAVPLGFPIGRSVRSTWGVNFKSRRSKYRRARRRQREDR